MATYLPMDIVFTHILPKLPAKSLLRFKCVSKSFLSEITSQKFNASFSEANHFLVVSVQNLVQSRVGFRIYELDSPQSPPTFFRYPRTSPYCNNVVACCESYLLIVNTYARLSNPVLLNPTTRIYRELAKVDFPNNSFMLCELYGMCHSDEFGGDFKIARFIDFYVSPKNMREVQVYNMRTNSWKLVECKARGSESFNIGWLNDPVLIENHLLHIVFRDEDGSTKTRTRIGCFDMKAERWSHDVVLPDTLPCENNSNDLSMMCFSQLDGKLCISCFNSKYSTSNLWVLKEYGIKGSWTKLMSISVNLENTSLWKSVYRAIRYCKGSPDKLLCMRSCELYWHNLRDKTTETRFNYEYSGYGYICKRSLLNFPGGQPFEVSSEEPENYYTDDECLTHYF